MERFLEKKLKIAKITDKVRIEQANVTDIKFKDNTFDATISVL
ncbi:MAG: hypothetical protein Kow0019_08780 [Methanobacteriaceae archaeon]